MLKAAIIPQGGSQSLSLSCPCNEILYEGTRGPGKTAAQLMRFRRLVGLGYGQFWKGVIFDIEYKNLSDIISQSKKIFNKFDDGARFLKSPSELKWVWPTGEELLFRYEKNAEGYWNYHGQEFPFIGFNELTKRADPEFYEAMFSCMRTSFRPEDYPLPDGSLLPSIPLENFSTTNPFGVGHTWVKRRFIDPVPRGTVFRERMMILNPETEKEQEIILTRVAIHGSWKENKFLDPTYIAFLMKIKDPNKRKAWVDGSWSITSGGRFDHLWREHVHIVEPFQIPDGWRVDRSHDWGESKPFSNLWFAEADGHQYEINGRHIAYPKGTLFCIGEFYGCKEDEHNKGLGMSASNVAKVVSDIDQALMDKTHVIENPCGEINLIPGIVTGQVVPGPADNAIMNKNDEQISIADKMESQGVEWTESDKSPGSRIAGAALLCEMLEAALEGVDSEAGVPERPAIYFFNNVRGIISRFPVLSRDTKNPDDVDTEQEDHDYDALRYRATKGEKEYADSLEIRFPS
ncbi:MAG: terminase [Candidatus Thorarchaeota archaeon]